MIRVPESILDPWSERPGQTLQNPSVAPGAMKNSGQVLRPHPRAIFLVDVEAFIERNPENRREPLLLGLGRNLPLCEQNTKS